MNNWYHQMRFEDQLQPSIPRPTLGLEQKQEEASVYEHLTELIGEEQGHIWDGSGSDPYSCVTGLSNLMRRRLQENEERPGWDQDSKWELIMALTSAAEKLMLRAAAAAGYECTVYVNQLGHEGHQPKPGEVAAAIKQGADVANFTAFLLERDQAEKLALLEGLPSWPLYVDGRPSRAHKECSLYKLRLTSNGYTLMQWSSRWLCYQAVVYGMSAERAIYTLKKMHAITERKRQCRRCMGFHFTEHCLERDSEGEALDYDAGEPLPHRHNEAHRPTDPYCSNCKPYCPPCGDSGTRPDGTPCDSCEGFDERAT